MNFKTIKKDGGYYEENVFGFYFYIRMIDLVRKKDFHNSKKRRKL